MVVVNRERFCPSVSNPFLVATKRLSNSESICRYVSCFELFGLLGATSDVEAEAEAPEAAISYGSGSGKHEMNGSGSSEKI